MIRPYSQILSRPGAWQFSAAGLIARMPMSTLGLGTILMISTLYNSYALAGQVVGVFIGAAALAAPQLAKLVDRRGQARVMFPAMALAMSAATGLIIAATNHWPAWVLYALAVVMGTTIGQLGPLVRSRWKNLLDDPRQLHTAFSLESAVDELIFIVGPVLATYMATTLHPAAGVITAIVTLAIGGTWFLSQRGTEPPPRARSEGHRGTLLRLPGLAAVCVVFIGLGGLFGAYDVAIVAFATEANQRDLAGLVLAAMAAGSLIGGLGYGARHWLSPLWVRFAVGCAALGLGVAVLPFVTSITVLAAVAFVLGFAVAPTLINGTTIAEIVAPSARLTEALAWISTSLGVGVAAGSWFAGHQIDLVGSHGGFVVTLYCGLMVAAAGLGAARFIGSHVRRAYELARATALQSHAPAGATGAR